jgi:hypothetical protein
MDLDIQLSETLSEVQEVLSRPNEWLSPPIGPCYARSISAVVTTPDDGAQRAIYRYATGTNALGEKDYVRFLIVGNQCVEWPVDSFIYTPEYEESLHEQNCQYLAKNSLYLRNWRILQITPDADDLLNLVKRTGCNFVSIGKVGRWIEFITLRGDPDHLEIDCEGRFALVVRKTIHKCKKPIPGIPDYLQDVVQELSHALRCKLREDDLIYRQPTKVGFKSFGTLQVRIG